MVTGDTVWSLQYHTACREVLQFQYLLLGLGWCVRECSSSLCCSERDTGVLTHGCVLWELSPLTELIWRDQNTEGMIFLHC